MKEKLYRFMIGRNGVDHYSRFLLYAGLVVWLLDIFLSTGILSTVALAMIIYSNFRMYSKKLDKRRAENAAYLRWHNKVVYGWRSWRERMKQRKDYAFFRCPSCKAMLRVPRGKGRIRVTCRKCGNAFEKKT